MVSPKLIKDQAWRDRTFNQWHDLINMSHTELRDWLRNDMRKLASLSATRAKTLGIYSGLRSLKNIARKVEVPQDRWTKREYTEAVREIGFNRRMLGMSPGRPISAKHTVSKWEISLRNWGHDPRRANSPGRSKMEHWYKKYFARSVPSVGDTFS